MAGSRMSLFDCRNRRVQINHLEAVLYEYPFANGRILKGFHGQACYGTIYPASGERNHTINKNKSTWSELFGLITALFVLHLA